LENLTKTSLERRRMEVSNAIKGIQIMRAESDIT